MSPFIDAGIKIPISTTNLETTTQPASYTFMKTNRNLMLTAGVFLTLAIQLATVNVAQAQTKVLINAFHNSDEVTVNNGNPWANWFGAAFYQVLWDASDASNNVASGSLKIEAFFPDSGIGGGSGPQFLAYNQNDGINPPLVGNGGPSSSALATNVEMDVRFEPDSAYNTNASNWPTIEVGTRGTEFNQYTFGTFTIPHSETNWVRVSIPIASSPNWVSIPNIFIKHYSTALNGWVRMYVDNITFTTASVQVAPPTLTIAKARPALRFFAGPSQYQRTQLASVDQNQSWVGGSYPVSYKFTVSDYDINSPLNEFHVFLMPLNHVQGGSVGQYTDYNDAANNLRLQLTGGAAGTPTVFANLAWKTNLLGENPTNTVLSITNETAIGTWTLTFNSATAGTLTAPGASPAAFSLPADVAATFANPLVAFFGVQPNPTAAIGQHIELTSIQTVNVASPGVPISSDFTTGAGINTNIWLTTSVSQDASLMVPVDHNHPWWVNWTYPDGGFELGTKADLANGAVPWKTPGYFTGYDTNTPVSKKYVGNRVNTLIPTAALPSASGLSNSVPAGNAFFRLSNPAPAE